jgi:hypothetical protein
MTLISSADARVMGDIRALYDPRLKLYILTS